MSSVAEHRAAIVRIGQRANDQVRPLSDPMWDAAQRVMDEHWRAIELATGRVLVSVPSDPREPLRLR
jgi:hypothetical protein